MLAVRSCPVPPEDGPELDVRRVPAGGSVTVTFLGTSLHGFWTHWHVHRERTEPCIEPQESCPGCKAEMPTRWRGYIHCFDHGERDQCLYELTCGAAKQLIQAMIGKEDYRGIQAQITRGKGKKARLYVAIRKLPDAQTLARLPAERAPIVTLTKLWGYADRRTPKFPNSDLI